MQDSPIAFGLDEGQPFDARCLSWRLPDELGRQAAVSIWTIVGRMKNVRILGDPKQLIVLCTRSIGETDLIRWDGRWLLHVTVETQAPLAQPRNGFVDVDLGIVDIATTGDGARASTVTGSTGTASGNSDCGKGCRPRRPARRAGC